MPTFWERATTHDAGGNEPLELGFFELALQLYAADVVPSSIFERGELALTLPQQQELTDLLATMPATPESRVAWRARIISVFYGARLYLEQLDTIDKAKTALGVP
jgi:hypothetical protein